MAMVITDRRRTAPKGYLTPFLLCAGEARAAPIKFAADSKAEKSIPIHDQRPQEQRAIAAEKAFGPEVKKAVKRIEKARKKETPQ
jgi:hypothetical protein